MLARSCIQGRIQDFFEKGVQLYKGGKGGFNLLFYNSIFLNIPMEMK